jgi:hypothetical protein
MITIYSHLDPAAIVYRAPLASLVGADLRDVCLAFADLRNMNLESADLRGVDLDERVAPGGQPDVRSAGRGGHERGGCGRLQPGRGDPRGGQVRRRRFQPHYALTLVLRARQSATFALSALTIR